MDANSWRCKECDWQGSGDALLTAKNPFDLTEFISGCPQCRSIDQFVGVCDEPDCTQDAGCGWPSPTGYRHTCGKHYQCTPASPTPQDQR